MNRSATVFASLLFFTSFLVNACSSTASNAPDDNTDSSTDPLKAAAACEKKACGESCTICAPNTNCFETAVPKLCNAQGLCAASSTVQCSPPSPPTPYEPCGGKACGEQCSTCSPNDSTCSSTMELKVCHPDGSCKGGTPTCAPPKYDPCEAKACGESCTQCAPDDSNCFETAVLKFCHPGGSCDATVPECKPISPND
jgi:hypothetical protein